VPGEELVDCIDQAGKAEHAKESSKRARDANPLEDDDTATSVSGNESAIRKHQPPTLSSSLFRNRGEKALCLFVCQWKQCERGFAIEPGDDPRRPAAEPSRAGVEQDGTSKKWRVVGSLSWDHDGLPCLPTLQ
jgi:hypothetical protein